MYPYVVSLYCCYLYHFYAPDWECLILHIVSLASAENVTSYFEVEGHVMHAVLICYNPLQKCKYFGDLIIENDVEAA